MSNKFKVLNEETARKLQLRLINKLWEALEENPSASLFAVVERQLARLHMGLVDLPDKADMTEEEKKIVEDFEKMESDMDSAIFTTTKTEH